MTTIPYLEQQAHKWPLIPLMVTSFAIPYLIAYLSFTPSTRWIRIAIWPVCALSYLAALGRQGGPLLGMRFAHQGLMAVFASGIRYAFTSKPPLIHPPPREPVLGFLRKSRAGKAFHLLYFEQRRVGISPNPPIVHQGLSYFPALGLQLVRVLFAFAMFDLVTYPIVYLAPTTYGAMHMRDYPSFVVWVKGLAVDYGVDWRIIWTLLAWSYSLGSVYGFELGAHIAAFISIAIGFNIESEWPRVSDWWLYKPSSLNEFWGTRYHQILREPLLFWSSPFANTSRSIHILATFFMSTMFHVIMFYSIDRRLSFVSIAIFFMGQGLGCVFERYLLRSHGIRVRGPIGRIWMIAVLTLTTIPLVNEHHEMGWAGAIRKGFTETPETSVIQWILYALGKPNLIEAKGKKI